MSDQLIQFIEGYTGNFGFLLSVKKQWLQKGRLSDKQWAAVSKCAGREQPEYRTKQYGGRCEDAPCCGCCGGADERFGDYADRY